MTIPQTQRSVPEVLQDIIGNLQMMVRGEFRLAKRELSEKASAASRPATILGVGLVTGFYGVGFLLLALVYGLSTIMAAWLAALIVGAVLALCGCALAITGGTKLKSLPITPDKTISSLEENAQWAKRQIK
jgi:hypothetical protein